MGSKKNVPTPWSATNAPINCIKSPTARVHGNSSTSQFRSSEARLEEKSWCKESFEQNRARRTKNRTRIGIQLLNPQNIRKRSEPNFWIVLNVDFFLTFFFLVLFLSLSVSFSFSFFLYHSLILTLSLFFFLSLSLSLSLFLSFLWFMYGLPHFTSLKPLSNSN